jgi:hypothetical protein
MTFAPLEVPARVGVFGVNGRVGSMFFNDTVKKTLILGGRLPGLRVFDRGRGSKKKACFQHVRSVLHHRHHTTEFIEDPERLGVAKLPTTFPNP